MKIEKTFLYYFLLAILVSGCMASKHPGVTSFEEPAKSHADYQTWYLYYEDQLDARKGDVTPPDSSYPQEARNGYTQAKKEWDDKVRVARNSNIGMGFVAASIIASIIIATSSGY